MPGPFDSAAKRLLREKPEHYVKWLVDQATFVRQLPTELKSRNIYADGLLYIMVNGKPELLHIEFQTNNDPKMGQRLLEYNILASSENDSLPVYTVVIYLRSDGNVPKSPFIRKHWNGKEYHRFDFEVVELAKIPARTLLDKGLLGVLPLLSMTDGGTEPAVMEEMTTMLLDAGERELLALAFMFGNTIKGGQAYKEWFKRRLAMLDDLLEKSPLYQELLRRGAEEGRKEGRKEGLEEGLEEGRKQERQRRIQDRRDTVVSFVQMRFPELIPLAEQQVNSIQDLDELHNLLLRLFAAQDAEEATQLLTETHEE
ncbi:MAG TPA: hypothetical protein VFA09_27670 [Ktedonobacteraceae bacterium]|nr:hypothetical protein [Ktedonobacteraceae bacterium]